MSQNEIATTEERYISQVTQFEKYLDSLGLPSENIIASIDEAV